MKDNHPEDADLSLSPSDTSSPDLERKNITDDTLLIQSKSPRRVKVYLLQGDDWLDNGTGYCMGKVDSETHKPYFIVRNELDSEDVILQSYLEGCIQYQRQQETLIVWSDSSGKDLALSFQENEGCADLCDFIVKVQQENLSPMISLYYVITSQVHDGSSSTEGTREVTELIAGPITYPPARPVCEDLAKMLDIFVQGSNSIYSRFKILSFVVENKYLIRLYELFLECEKQRDLEGLHSLNDIVKQLLVYNEAILFKDFFSSKKSILALAGILEYHRELPQFKADHRGALKKEYKFKCLSKINDQPLFFGSELSIFRMEFVLVYFRSIFLSTIFDDQVIGTLSSMIYKCQLEVLNYLRRSLANGNFLETLILLLSIVSIDIEQKRDIIRMIHYYTILAKCHVAAIKPEFFGSLIRCGFSTVVTLALEDSDPSIQALGTELVVTVLDQDVSFINTPASNESHVDELEDAEVCANEASANDSTPEPLRLKLVHDVSLSVSLSRVLLQATCSGLQMQAFEALKSILYAAAAEISAVGDPRSSDEESGNKEDSGASKELSEKHYRQFYDSIAPVLFVDFINILDDNESTRKEAEANFVSKPQLYNHICDIITFCCREHDHDMCCNYLLNTGLIRGLFEALSLKVNLIFKLAVIRCLKSILLMNDLDVSLYIIRHDLFSYFFQFFEVVISHNSCANSLCLDLLTVIEKHTSNEAGLVIAAYIYKIYRNFLEIKLENIAVGRSFLQTFEAAEKLFQMNEHSEPDTESGDSEKPVVTHQLSSPICETSVETAAEAEAEAKAKSANVLTKATANDISGNDIFQDLKLQNKGSKRERDLSGDGILANGDFFQVDSSKRKTPVLWADKPNLEEEACT